MRDGDTIYATSSGTPPAAIAIVRVSGRNARAVGVALAGSIPTPRQASLRALHHPTSGAMLDRAIILYFPGPSTATGEDLIEFHVHGGRAVVAAIEAAIALIPGTRFADAGEFTHRALANGRIDLTEAEGLGDLLAAQTETQRRAALRNAEGGLRADIDGWTDVLVAIAAEIEAALDFSDEDDVADQSVDQLRTKIANVAHAIAAVLSTPPVERLYDGIRVVIAGPPNSGKSTLLNAMTGRDIAIVSPISGTTRDRIEAPVVRNGIAYVITDTAGLTLFPGDDVERIGVERAHEAVAGADIVLWLDDAEAIEPRFVAVHARADVPGREAVPLGRLALSAQDEWGIDRLWTEIDRRASLLLPQENSVTVNVRQRALLGNCADHLVVALQQDDLLIVAEEVRRSLRQLDAVAGRSGVEDVLGSIFARFCIGK